VSSQDQSIDLHVSCPDEGSADSWFAIGFSEVGGMLGSDLFTVQFDSSS